MATKYEKTFNVGPTHVLATLESIDEYIDDLKEPVARQALKNSYRSIPLYYRGRPIYLKDGKQTRIG